MKAKSSHLMSSQIAELEAIALGYVPEPCLTMNYFKRTVVEVALGLFFRREGLAGREEGDVGASDGRITIQGFRQDLSTCWSFFNRIR